MSNTRERITQATYGSKKKDDARVSVVDAVLLCYRKMYQFRCFISTLGNRTKPVQSIVSSKKCRARPVPITGRAPPSFDYSCGRKTMKATAKAAMMMKFPQAAAGSTPESSPHRKTRAARMVQTISILTIIATLSTTASL